MKKCFFSILLTYSLSLQAAEHHFVTPLEKAQWKVQASPLVCRMTHEISQYGRAIFAQRNARPPYFLLHSWRFLSQSLKGKLYAVAPHWKTRRLAHFIDHVTLQPGQFPVHLAELNSATLLSQLSLGDVPRFIYQSEVGDIIRVDVSPVNFQEAYEKYLRCLAQLLDFSYQDVANTQIYFDTSSDRLSEKAKFLLNRVKLYIHADKKITRVKISGHTDNQGRWYFNKKLSKQRADRVKDFLLAGGIDAEMLEVDYHADRIPQHSNRRANGRTKNRRVEIILERE